MRTTLPEAIVEKEVELPSDKWRQLLEDHGGGPLSPINFAFWTIAMPKQYERPQYYEFISSIYARGEVEPPVAYVDGYHPLVAGSNVFNYFIQDHLIREARYVVVDISVMRHNSLFEAGFAVGIGAQVRYYFDEYNPVRALYKTEEGVFSTDGEARRHLPTCAQYSEVARVEIPMVNKGILTRSRSERRKFKDFLNKRIHKPVALSPRRRQCPKVHHRDTTCQFGREFGRLTSQRYFYQIAQSAHVAQADFIAQYLRNRGAVEAQTALPAAMSDQSPLCRTCFCLQVAEYIVVDGTAPRNYSVDAGECAFTLGMAVAFSRTRSVKRVFMHYEEPIGALGMYAGGRAGWAWERWETQLGEQFDGWFY